MGEAILQLRSTVVLPKDRPAPEVRPNPEQRQLLAAYFWKFLREPCNALALPLDCVYASVLHLNQYTDDCGYYKGAVLGVLQQHGISRLASKLYMDRMVVIPRVFADYTAKDRMIRAVKRIEKMYFVLIQGIEASTHPDPKLGGWSWARVHTIKHEPNERGIAYASSRQAAIARACKDLSPMHWIRAMKKCVGGVAERFKLVVSGERKADRPYPTWRGECELPLWSGQEPYNVLSGWTRLLSFYTPDYLEFRDKVGVHEC
jgi:hypothetical protein